MPRGKGKVVGTLRHKSGIAVEIRLMPDRTFQAEYQGATFHNAGYEKLEGELWKVIEESLQTQWFKVIKITELHPFCDGDPERFVGILVSRFFVGINQGQRQLRYNWTEDDDQPNERWAGELSPRLQVQDGQLVLPDYRGASSRDERVYYLAYTPELWQGLLQLVEAIAKLKAKLRELLGSEQGLLTISTVGARALMGLPAPGETHDDD
jgi:hypothetical protein